MKILIVDDSAVMRKIVIRALRQAGVSADATLEAADGREALAVIAAEHPHVILSDWNMPNMTGMELLTELRAGGDDTPFGFVTSESTPDMSNAASAAGAAFFIVKPFTADDLRDALGRVAA